MLNAEQERRGRFIRVNAAFADMLRWRPEDLIDLALTDVTHSDDIPTTKAGLDAILRGELLDDERPKRYVRADGSMAWGYLRATLVRGADGAPRYALGALADDPRARRLRRSRRASRSCSTSRRSSRASGVWEAALPTTSSTCRR